MSPVYDHTTWIEAGRRRNERWLHAFAAAIAGLVTISYAVQSLGPTQTEVSGPLAAAVGVIGAFYAILALRGVPAGREGPIRWVATTIEVSVPTVVIAVDSLLGAEHALLDTPAALWTIAIFVTVLRLRPALSLYAGALAAAEWLVAYAVLSRGQHFELDVLQWPSAWRRGFLLFTAGVLAWRLADAMLALTARVELATMEREKVRRAFGAYVAEPVVQRVLSGDLALRIERRALTVLFVDIRGFTAFAESHPPQEVVGCLNAALEQFSVEVQRHGGIVNKFLGDGLMALFGAPEDDPDHAGRAVAAAVAIRHVARRLAADGTFPGLRVGIGVHAGDVVVGDVGGEKQREYTAIGDVVNVASRVEGATKEVGVDLLITEDVARHVGDRWPLRALDAVQLRGRAAPVTVYGIDEA